MRLSSTGTTAASVLLILCALPGNVLLLYQAPALAAATAIHQENNLLENGQLLLLLACLVIFAAHAVHSEDRAARLLALAAVLLSFTFIIRESDLRPFGISGAITWFSDGPGRYVLLTPPWLGLLWAMARHYRPVLRRLRRLLFSAAGAAFACSVLLLAAGILLDKSVIKLAPSRYYEELFELNGYLFLLLGALAAGGHLTVAAAAESQPA